MNYQKYSQTELIKNCYMISIIDGSLIDLKCRKHFEKSNAFNLENADNFSVMLGKRNFQVFDYIKKKYLNKYRKKNSSQEQNYFNQNTELTTDKKLNKYNHLCANKIFTNLQQEKPRLNLDSNLKKIKLQKISEKPNNLFNKSLLSSKGIISTMSFNSNKKIEKAFFPGLNNSYLIDKKDKEIQLNGCQNRKTNKDYKVALKDFKTTILNDKVNLKLKNQIYNKILNNIICMYQSKTNLIKLSIEKIKFEKLLNSLNFDHCNLDAFHNLLQKFLLGHQILKRDMKLSDLEIILFFVFLVKKKFKNLKHLKWTCDSLNKMRSYGVNKRSEQNYKIILKRFFKIVIQNFNKERNLKKKNDLEFYRFYFEEISNKFNHDWHKLRFETVFNETKVSNSDDYRRQSKKYFARILKNSKPFMLLLDNYLTNKLVIKGKTHGIMLDYLPILKKKSYLLTSKWKNYFDPTKIKDFVINFVIDQLKNNKVKLPWSLVEITQGVANVRRLFERVE